MTLHVLARGLLAGLILTLSTFPPSYACENCESVEGGNVQTPDLNLSERERNRLLAMQLFMDRGMDMEQLAPLYELWERESKWQRTAANPKSTARGIPQAMSSLNPETWDPSWLFDPRKQIEWGLDYIDKRYGSPSKALAFHDRKGWY
jgi:hypothetical protein